MDASFSPDGRYVVTASSDGTAGVWDAASGRSVTPPLKHAAGVARASFSPDGRLILTASDDHTARVWDWHGTGLPYLTMLHPAVVLRAAFSCDDHNVITLSVDGTAQVWDITTGNRLAMIETNLVGTRRGQFSPDGHLLATAHTNGVARIWDVETGLAASPPLTHTSLVNHLEFSPDGKCIVTAGADRCACVWEVPSGRLVSQMKHREAVNYATFTADGSQVLTVSASVPEFFQAGEYWAFGLAEREAITAIWGQAQMWTVATGEPVTPPRKLGTSVSQVAVSPDRRTLIPTCSARALTGNQVWALDLITGERRKRAFQHEDGVIHASLSPDGRWLATVSWDQSARIWDAATGQPAGPRLAHQKTVYHASFSSDSRLVATASEDRTARVWDAATGEPVTPWLKHRVAVHRAFFSPDGRGLLTAGVDGMVHVWELPRNGRSAQDESLRAELLAGRQIDETGAVLPASQDLMERAWLNWRPQDARDSGRAPGSVVAQQGASAERAGEYNGMSEPARKPISPGKEYRDRAFSTINKLGYGASPLSSTQWTEIIEQFSRAIEAEPHAGNLMYFWRSRAFEQTGQFQKAINDCRESLWRMGLVPIKSDIARDYLTRGRCYLLLGESEKAEADFRTAAELSPDDFRTYYQPALAYEEVGQFQQATHEFSEAIRRATNQTNVLAQLYFLRGRNYLRLGKNAKAEADFRKVTEYMPADAGGYNNLAWYYVTGPTNFRSPEKALPLALKAVELGKTNHNELNTLGVVYYRLGQLTNAITVLETGIKADQEGGSAHDFFFLAMSYQRLGRAAKAADCYARALRWLGAQSAISSQDKQDLEEFRSEAEGVLGEQAQGQK